MSSSRLRIVEVSDAFFPHLDGVTHVMHHYALELHNAHQVVVVAPKRRRYNYNQLPYRFEGVPALYVPLLDLEAPWPHFGLLALKRLLDKEAVDIIHIHSPLVLGPMLIPLAKKKGIKVVATLHSRYTEDFKKFIPFQWLRNILIRRMARFFSQCDSVWTVNHGMVQELRKIGYQGPVTVMPNATEYEKLDHVDERKASIIKKYHLNAYQPIGLFVGQQSLKKNIALTLQALSLLKAKGEIVQFVSVGAGEDAKVLKKLADQLGLSDQVHFVGKITDRNELANVYLAADLFLFPSTYDASSLAVIEAAALGVPSILIRGAITAEAIIDRSNGYLTNESPEEYAETIRFALADPNRSQVANQATLTLTKSWKTVCEDVITTYSEVISRND